MASKKKNDNQAAAAPEGPAAKTTAASGDGGKAGDILERVSAYLDGSRGFGESFPEAANLAAEPRAAQAQAEKENETAYAERRLAAQNLTRSKAEALIAAPQTRPYWENPKDDVRAFAIYGRVVDSRDGQGLPGITVRAIDLDRKKDDLLGTAVSDSDGRFNFRFAAKDFSGKEGEDDAIPEVYLEVLDEEGKRVTRTAKSFEDKTPSGTAFVISLDPKPFPAAVAAKQRLLAGKAEELSRLQRLARSQQVKLPAAELAIPVGSLRAGAPGPGAPDHPVGAAGTSAPAPATAAAAAPGAAAGASVKPRAAAKPKPRPKPGK